MQELVGRLTALDPEASESLKVVGYFDALVGGQVSVDVLASSAAVLAGCPVGVTLSDGRSTRMSPGGERLAAAEEHDWPAHDAGPGDRVWIERASAPHTNDAMLLERFAIAVAITRSRSDSDSSLHRAAELVVDATVSADDRAAAAARLRLDAHELVQAVALPAAAPADRYPSAVLSTPFGLARVVLVPAPLDGKSGGWEGSSPAGIGLAVDPARLPKSWASALVALRLSGPGEAVVQAERLGSLLVLAEAADADPDAHPDVVALERLALERGALPTLDALADTGSVRAAATALGVHHSTVQARLLGLVDTLGYDPRLPDGRTRYVLARTLHRLRAARF
jgi:hypothetical protein